MSNYIVGESSDLFDPATGKWVGVLDRQGREHVINPGDALPALVSGDGNTTKNDTSAAASNLAAINALLAAGRPVVLNGLSTDIIWLSGHITVPDGGVLETRGPVLKLASGVQDYVIGTAAEEAAYSSVTVTWSSGMTASIAWAAHGCSLNDAVVLQGTLGTTTQNWFDVVRVVGVTDANTIVVQLEWLPTAGPSGTMTAKRCTRNIKVNARVNHNYSSNGAGSGRARMASVMSFIADSTVHIEADPDTAKYVCLLAGAINVNGSARGTPTTTSDTLKYYGPMRNVRMHAAGAAANEDCATVQAIEPDAFLAYMPCYGVMGGITLDRPDAVTGGGSGAVVLYGSQDFKVGSVKIVGGRMQSYGSTPGLKFKFGRGNPSSELYEEICVTDATIASATGDVCASENFQARTLRFDGTKFVRPQSSSQRIFVVGATSVFRTVSFENLTLDLGAYPDGSTAWPIVVSGSVDVLIFRNVVVRGGSTMRLVYLSNGSSVKEIKFIDCQVDGIDKLVDFNASALTAPRVTIDGGYYKVPNLVSCKITGCVVEISAGTIVDAATLGVLRYDTAATYGRLIDHGASYINSAVPVSSANGGTVELMAPRTSFDIGSTALRKVAGAECITTTLRGTIPAGSAAISDGTSWFSKTNPSLTY